MHHMVVPHTMAGMVCMGKAGALPPAHVLVTSCLVQISPIHRASLQGQVTSGLGAMRKYTNQLRVCQQITPRLVTFTPHAALSSLL